MEIIRLDLAVVQGNFNDNPLLDTMSSLLLKIKNKFRFVLKTVGQSMFPLLLDNDVVYFKKIAYSMLKEDDIALVEKNNFFFTHRIIYKTDSYCITKGDNNAKSDEKISPKKISGKVYQIKRGNHLINIDEVYLFQSSLYFQEIIKVKNVLEKEGVDFIFLKGLPFHLYYEKRHPKRLYADCDILIKPRDQKKIEAIFVKFGYKKTHPTLPEISYSKIINNFPIVFDVHLKAVFLMTQINRLESLYPEKLVLDFTNDLFLNKKSVKINGQSFFILNSTYLIIYLSLHFFHHNFMGIFRLKLLDKVIRQSRLKNSDWKKIREEINRFRLNNFIAPVFFLLKKYYQTPIPDFIHPPNRRVNLKNLGIFDSEERMAAGIRRFDNIFRLSPQPLLVKLTVLLNYEVIMWTFLALFERLFRFSKDLLAKPSSQSVPY